MKEIEVKILEINPEEIRKKLKSFKATKIHDSNIHAIQFDFPDGRIEKKHQLLRVRKVGEKVELCFKSGRKKTKFKSQEEIEVNTTSFEDTIKILEALGFKKTPEQKRRRESYLLGKVKFELDFYPSIPPLLEIESQSEEEVEKWVQKLGYSMKQTSNLTGQEVEKQYQRK